MIKYYIFTYVLITISLSSCSKFIGSNKNCNDLYSSLYATYDYENQNNYKNMQFDSINLIQDSIVQTIISRCNIRPEIIDFIYSRNLYLMQFDKGILILEKIPENSYKFEFDKANKIGVLRLFKYSLSNENDLYTEVENELLVELSKYQFSKDSVYITVQKEFIKNINCSIDDINNKIDSLSIDSLNYGNEIKNYLKTYLTNLIGLKEHFIEMESFPNNKTNSKGTSEEENYLRTAN